MDTGSPPPTGDTETQETVDDSDTGCPDYGSTDGYYEPLGIMLSVGGAVRDRELAATGYEVAGDMPAYFEVDYFSDEAFYSGSSHDWRLRHGL